MDKELDIGATDKDSKSQNIINSCRGGTAKDSITDQTKDLPPKHVAQDSYAMSSDVSPYP